MVIIKSNLYVQEEDRWRLYNELVEMANRGVILLPPFCELLNEVPPDAEVVVIKEKE